MGYQLADSFSGFAYSFFGSCIILFLINLIPGCHLRASEEAEVLGIDEAEIGEFAVSQVNSESNCFEITWLMIVSTTMSSLPVMWSMVNRLVMRNLSIQPAIVDLRWNQIRKGFHLLRRLAYRSSLFCKVNNVNHSEGF